MGETGGESTGSVSSTGGDRGSFSASSMVSDAWNHESINREGPFFSLPGIIGVDSAGVPEASDALLCNRPGMDPRRLNLVGMGIMLGSWLDYVIQGCNATVLLRYDADEVIKQGWCWCSTQIRLTVSKAIVHMGNTKRPFMHVDDY